MNLHWSDDGGVTYGNTHQRVSQSGQKRIMWHNMGSGRDRVFEAWGNINGRLAIARCDVDVEPEFPASPTRPRQIPA